MRFQKIPFRVKETANCPLYLKEDCFVLSGIAVLMDGGGAVLDQTGARVRQRLGALADAGRLGLLRVERRDASAPLATQSLVVFLGVAAAAFAAFILSR